MSRNDLGFIAEKAKKLASEIRDFNDGHQAVRPIGKTMTTSRPVQLQVNTAGAWKTVLQFDAGDDAVADKVQQGALLLHEATGSNWRIATRDRLPVVLRHLGRNTYGMWLDRTPS